MRYFTFLVCFPALAQLGNSSLSGTITDPASAAIPNATITLRSTNQAFVRTTTTGDTGQYVIPTLPPGRYQLSVTANGFTENRTQDFELSSGQAGSLNVTLQVRTQETQLTVEASAPVLQTTSASVGSAVTARQMTNLPLAGRSFLNAIAIAPGVVPVGPAGSTTNHSPVNQSTMPSVFGQRQKDNNFLLDGVENRDPNLLGVAVYPPPEAIAEMKVDSGVGSAAYGHASGATIDVVSKSGSDAWHADGWEYFRNNVLDARSFFVPSIGAYRWNQFGAAAGGPAFIPGVLKKDKHWYVFGYYEGVRIRQASNYTGNIPTPANLAGDFSGTAPIYDPFSTAAGPNNTFTRQPFPNNRIPESRLNASVQTLAHAIYPEPNLAPGVIPGQNYINTAGNRQEGDQWSIRADHQFGQRDRFLGRYTTADNPSSGVSLPSITGFQSDVLRNAVVSDTHIFSPSFLLTGRYGLTTVDYQSGNNVPRGLAESIGLSAV